MKRTVAFLLVLMVILLMGGCRKTGTADVQPLSQSTEENWGMGEF